MAEVVSFEGHKAQKHIEQALLLFYSDPPDSGHQTGYMCGLASVYVECLNGPTEDERIATVLRWAGFEVE